MRPLVLILPAILSACGGHSDRSAGQAAPRAAILPASGAQSQMPAKAGTEMKLIPLPKDKAQLTRLIAMGYTVHEDHLHPPGVKSCPFDKKGGSVVE